MSGFTAEWLALREPADAACRSTDVTRFVADYLASREGVTIVDLGCGSGSNVRYLAARLPQPQRWRVVDNDPHLLQRAELAAPCVHAFHSDLAVLAPDWFEGADLVTASALLDLVSDAWLAGLVERCSAGGAAVLAVLDYDGRIVCRPSDRDDMYVAELVNRHQRTDKGLGPALGPDAGRRLAEMLAAAGNDVRRATSDWVLGTESSELQRQLIRGWGDAARELRPSERARIDAWQQRRLEYVDTGTSHLVVGHDDVAGVPR
jgi:hypothetical protein